MMFELPYIFYQNILIGSSCIFKFLAKIPIYGIAPPDKDGPDVELSLSGYNGN